MISLAYIPAVLFGSAAALALFDWLFIPRFKASANVRSRQRWLRFASSFDRSFALVGFFIFAALALLSLIFADGVA